MSYSVVVPAPVPLPPLLFLGLFLYVCNLAIVNAADADAAPRPAPAAVSALVDWSSILTLRFKVSTTVKEKDKYQWLAFITVLLARQQSGLSFLRTYIHDVMGDITSRTTVAGPCNVSTNSRVITYPHEAQMCGNPRGNCFQVCLRHGRMYQLGIQPVNWAGLYMDCPLDSRKME